MIRITNTSLCNLSIPLQPEKGNRSKMLTIPAASPQGAGVAEIEAIDAITLARLRWHYDRRPFDGNASNKSETDENGNPRFLEIGILKFELDGAEPQEPKKTESSTRASSDIEPPRRAGAPKAKAAPKAAPKAKPRRVA
jgi:hypothetical protein